MADKIYAPLNVKARDGRFGEEFRIGAQADKLIAFIKEHTNAKGYINLEMTKRRATGKFGETHSVTLDTWEPATGAGARNDAAARRPSEHARQAVNAYAADPPYDGADDGDVPF